MTIATWGDLLVKKEYKMTKPILQNRDYTLSVAGTMGRNSVVAMLGNDMVIGRLKNNTITFRITDFTEEDTIVLICPEGGSITHAQLERGNKATDWTPAPEDAQEYTENKVAEAKKYVDDLEIGGRNYFSLTHLNSISPSSWAVDNAYVYNFTLEPNTKYILSSNVPTDGDSSKNVLYFNGSGTSSNGVWSNNPRIMETDSNGKLFIAIPTGRTHTNGILNGTYWVQLEKGNKVTDWTPAPEDVQAEIDSRPTFNDFDKTDKVTINGGNIKAGTISSENNYSWIDLDKGHFSFGNKRLIWDGSKMTVKAENIDLSGKVTFNDFNPGLQTTVDSKVTQSDVDSSINNMEVGGRNYWAISKEPWNLHLVPEGDGVFTNNITSFAFPIFRMDKLEVPVGETYTLSFEINVSDNAIQFGNSSFYVNGVSPGTSHNKPTLVKDKWVKVYATFNYIAENTNFVHIYIDGIPSSESFQIRNFQLEKGNKVTDWTPAPEDVDSSIGDVDDKATDAKNKTDSWSYSGKTTIDGGAIEADTITAAQIVANSITAEELDVDKISALTSELGDVTAGTITSENGNIHIDLNEGLINVSDKMFKIQGKDIADIEDLTQLEGKIDKEIEDREGFISYANGIVTIGQKNSPTNIQIKNDRISFMQNGTEVAYITEQTMEITHGIFVETAKIGEHKQQTLPGGHTVFTWEG